MYKRLIIAAVLVLLCAAVGLWSMNNSSDKADLMEEKIYLLRQGELEPEQVMDEWYKARELLELTIKHTELEAATDKITAVCFAEELTEEKTRQAFEALDSIRLSERPYLVNIF